MQRFILLVLPTQEIHDPIIAALQPTLNARVRAFNERDRTHHDFILEKLYALQKELEQIYPPEADIVIDKP